MATARRIKADAVTVFSAIGTGWNGKPLRHGPYTRKSDAKRAVTEQFSGRGKVQVATLEWKDVED